MVHVSFEQWPLVVLLGLGHCPYVGSAAAGIWEGRWFILLDILLQNVCPLIANEPQARRTHQGLLVNEIPIGQPDPGGRSINTNQCPFHFSPTTPTSVRFLNHQPGNMTEEPSKPCVACGWTPEQQDQCFYSSHVKLFYGASRCGVWSIGSDVIMKERPDEGPKTEVTMLKHLEAVHTDMDIPAPRVLRD